jgi:hypothetical protein
LSSSLRSHPFEVDGDTKLLRKESTEKGLTGELQ